MSIQKECLEKMGVDDCSGHVTTSKLTGETPDIFTFNLNWEASNQLTEDHLKVLLSTPEYFLTRHLFRHESTVHCKYWLKGIICESKTNFVTYYRRNKLKLRYLANLAENPK